MSASAMADGRRATSPIFDAAHRFIYPVALKLDKDASPNASASRFETVLAITLRAMRSGRV